MNTIQSHFEEVFKNLPEFSPEAVEFTRFIFYGGACSAIKIQSDAMRDGVSEAAYDALMHSLLDEVQGYLEWFAAQHDASFLSEFAGYTFKSKPS